MKISFYGKMTFPIICFFICGHIFGQNKYPPIKYNAFAMCIYKKGDSICNWKNCNIDIQLNLAGDTLNNISISGAKQVSYTIKRKIKSYNEIYSVTGKKQNNKVNWDFYDVYDNDIMEEGTIQWGIFDYPIDGQVSAMSIFLSNFTVVFRLKVP